VQEAQRLSQLVDNVLLFSRSTSVGVGAVQREPVPVGALVTDIVDTFRPQAASRGVAIALSVSDRVGSCAVDRQAVTRIVLNLLDNAVKYGPRGQTVRVYVDRQAGRLRIAVDDEGPGIPADQRERIWEPFWRAPGSAEGGTGLGLAIVRELAASHDGTAVCEGNAAGGSRFVVEILAPSATPPGAAPVGAATGHPV
jgi:signal transduction histidine kinase